MLKIKENTRDSLKFSVIPIGLWIFGSVFSLVGLLVILFLTENVTLSCDRQATPEPACTLRKLRVLSSENRILPLANIIQADIEVNTSSDGDDTYRNILLVDKSFLAQVTPSTLDSNRPIKIPLSMAYSSGYESHLQTTNKINAFLQDSSQNNLKLQVSNAWLIILFGGVFFIVGLILIVTSPIAICHLDRYSQELIFTQNRLWGNKTVTAPLKEVISARTEYSRSSSSSETMRVGIQLKEGRTLWFGMGYDNINNGQKYRIVSLVNDFLA